MRSLLEIAKGKVAGREPCKCGEQECDVCKIFGNTNKESKTGITRAVFRDSFLDAESIKMLNERNLTATEAKMENSINRISATVSTLRTTERVIAGLSFNFEIALRILKEDGDGQKVVDFLKNGMLLLEKDALGGSGSRGYGKIKFENVTFDGKELNLHG